MWIFNNIGDCLQKFRVFNDSATQLFFDYGKLVFDHRLTFVLVDNDFSLAAESYVFSRLLDAEFARSHKAVAIRCGTTAYTGTIKGDNLVAVEGCKPVDGSGKTGIEIMPAHRFTERDIHNVGGQGFGQQLQCLFTGLPFADANILTLFRAD